ncbi:hypothetical protein AVEN_52861-1 [Araneus ventricosus]|uniref:Uncharacterized protein n=1 Tax=Araneus ventricosus TaxID=182803 RepID=A0A4Y2WN93_ARAVE|nr:hypothetical protein AVEN_52861-1 [Araneus ventricosus]
MTKPGICVIKSPSADTFNYLMMREFQRQVEIDLAEESLVDSLVRIPANFMGYDVLCDKHLRMNGFFSKRVPISRLNIVLFCRYIQERNGRTVDFS